MKRAHVILLLAVLLVVPANAQRESYNWLFGHYAGLTWNATRDYTGAAMFGTDGGDTLLHDVPSIIPSSVNTSEGSFSVSDNAGALLFYSDGRTVWDRNGAAMPNGKSLNGHPSSAQSGIVIPYPGQAGKYIAFTLNYSVNDNLCYSVIDMGLNGGLGDVAAGQKNIPMSGHTGLLGETMTAVRAANKRDYWIVAVGRDGNASTFNTTVGYYLNVWKVDDDGVHTTVQGTTWATDAYNLEVSGYMRFSRDANYFWYSAYSNGGNNNNYVYGTFDSATGTFTSIKTKRSPANNAYGVEFSPSGRYIYLTNIIGNATVAGYSGTSRLYVYDFQELLAAPDPGVISPLKTIAAAGTQFNDGTGDDTFGGLGIGPVGRMYVAGAWQHSLFVIPNPDDDPANLKIYKLDNLLGDGAFNGWGLPSSTTLYFNVDVTPDEACENAPETFLLSITGGEDGAGFHSVSVDWGDGTPEVVNDNPVIGHTYPYAHTYKKAGAYTITLTCRDTFGNEIPGLSQTKEIRVNTCKLMVNPNVRSSF